MSARSYWIRLLIAVDQLGNTLTGGDPDETISSRVGKAAVAGSKWGLRAEAVIDWLFWEGHCRECIEADEDV